MVIADGTLKMKNGKTMMLKESNCVVMNGIMTHTMKKKMSDSKM